MEIDPTLTSTATGIDATENPYSTDCSTSTSTATGASTGRWTTGICYSAIQYWDISSIPDYSTITSVTYDFTVDGGLWGGGADCNIWSIEGNLSTETNQQRYDDARDGTEFLSDKTECRTAARHEESPSIT